VHSTSAGGRQELLCPAITQLQLQQQVNPAWIQHVSGQAVQWCTFSTAQTLLDNQKAFDTIRRREWAHSPLELPTGSSAGTSAEQRDSTLTSKCSNNRLPATRCTFQVHVLLRCGLRGRDSGGALTVQRSAQRTSGAQYRP